MGNATEAVQARDWRAAVEKIRLAISGRYLITRARRALEWETLHPRRPTCMYCHRYIQLGDEAIVVRLRLGTTGRLEVNPGTQDRLHEEHWLGEDDPQPFHISCYTEWRERLVEGFPWLPLLGEIPELP